MWKITFLMLCFTLKKVLCDLPCQPRSGAPDGGAVCVCSALYCDTVGRPPRLPSGGYYHYVTSLASPGFSRGTGHFTRDTSEDQVDAVFLINSTIQYQTILGFGGSFTDSSGIMASSLPEKAQEHFIESYFGSSGIEYNLCRMPMGGSDFSTRFYTLADVPGDKDLHYFNLTEEDYKFKISYIKRAMSASSRGMSIIGCPWNAPQWMKTQHGRPGDLSGYVKSEYLHSWATYYVKFIKAYQQNGIDIWAVSGTNEPVLALGEEIFTNNTLNLAPQQRAWLKRHLAPQLRAADLNVKFLTFEDSRAFMVYWMDRFAEDPTAFGLVDGIAVHWYHDYYYAGPHVMDIVHNKYPDKIILYTESSINRPFDRTSDAIKLGSWNRGALYAYFIIESLEHWASGFIDWNLALSTAGGPTIKVPIDAAILINSTSGEFYKQPIFYVMGHFSKFIPPGSRRIGVQVMKGDELLQARAGWRSVYPAVAPDVVAVTATTNPDGSCTSVVFNNKNSTVRIRLDIPQLGSSTMSIEENSINTFVYWL